VGQVAREEHGAEAGRQPQREQQAREAARALPVRGARCGRLLALLFEVNGVSLHVLP
jgi:hypothetical protein